MNPDAFTVYDFIALGQWLEKAQMEFEVMNEQIAHTEYLSLFAALIGRVIKTRSEYMALHNP